MQNLFTCSNITASAQFIPGPRERSTSLVVDMHCHMLVQAAEALARSHAPALPESAQRFASAQTRQASVAMVEGIRQQLVSASRRIEDMDAAGIDLQVISPAPGHYCYWADEELGRTLARIVNDHLAATAAAHEDRLLAFGTVPMQSPRLAVEELTRCVKELGMRGVEICSNIQGEELASEKFRPFFAAAQALGAVVFIHPSGYTEGTRLSQYHLNNVIGNPLDTSVAVSHLIFSGALDQLPDLKLLLAHGGGTIASYPGRFDHAHFARADCRGCAHPPSHYLSRMYFDSIVFDPSQLEWLARRHGAARIVAGTDYPYDMAETQLVDFVARSQLSPQDQRAVLGLNAAHLLGLDPEAALRRARHGTHHDHR